MTTYFIINSSTNEKLGTKKDKGEAHNFAMEQMSKHGQDCTVVTGNRFAALQLGGLVGGRVKPAGAPTILSEKNSRGVSLPKIGGVLTARPVEAMPESPKATDSPAPAVRVASAGESAACLPRRLSAPCRPSVHREA